MVASVPHFRLSWGGHLGSSVQDQWANRVNWANDGSGDSTDPAGYQQACDAAAAELLLWFRRTTSEISSSAYLDWVKFNFIGVDGLQREPNTTITEITGTNYGAMMSTPIWPQSYCLTLRTGLTRGRGHAGRIYPPMSGPPLSADMAYIGAPQATAMALSFATCMNHVRDAINPFLAPVGNAYDLVVHSVATDTLPAKVTEIVGVVCDRVADIQHRRNRQVPRAEGALALIADAA